MVLGLDQAPGLRPRQVREWARAGRDPRATWEAVAPLAIDNPWIALLVAPLLDEMGAAHAEAPGRARALRLALAEASRGLDRARRLIDGWGESLVGGWSRSGGRHWRVGSLDRLLRLESAAASRAVRRLTAVLTTTGARLVRLELVPAFRPPRGKTRRVRPWTSAAMRLDAFVRRYNHGRTDHAVIVAALEWHGFDLGAGSLGLKKQRVAQVLARRRPR